MGPTLEQLGNSQMLFLVAFYVLFLAVRIRGAVRRWRQPLLRGREWFFDVRVQPDFYSGAGKRILDRYRMRIFWPFVIDIPIAIYTLRSDRSALFAIAMLILAAVIHLNHLYSVDYAERQARQFAVSEAAEPVGAVMLSLTPRRLRDYTNAKLEWALAIVNVVSFAWLLRFYLAAPGAHSFREVFGGALFMVYVQIGYLLVKQMIVAWRSPVPQAQAAAHMEAREKSRKFYICMSDWARICAASALVFWPIEMSLSPAMASRLTAAYFGVWMAVWVGGTFWVEWKRKQLVGVKLRARPVKLPDFLRESEIAKWPLCFAPSAPMLILKGPRGYSLNLANALACASAAYLAGLVMLMVLLPKH